MNHGHPASDSDRPITRADLKAGQLATDEALARRGDGHPASEPERIEGLLAKHRKVADELHRMIQNSQGTKR